MSTRRILTFALIAAVYWFIQNPPGVTMINPACPPDPILEPAEVQKIRTLQETKDVYLLGPVSPDDASIIVIAGLDENSSQASWLDLQTGRLEAIEVKFLELARPG